MRSGLLKRCYKDFPRRKFLCFGDFKIGKTDFLQRFTNGTISQVSQPSHDCQVFVKMVEVPCSGERIGAEFYELPSTSNLEYNSCYMDNDFDGIVYFFEMTKSNICDELAQFLRAYSIASGASIWETPILLIGLKKDNICDERFEWYKGKVMGYLENIFPKDNILFFKRDPLDKRCRQELGCLNGFVETIALSKMVCKTAPPDYLMMNSVQSYRLLHTVRELMGLLANSIASKCWYYLKQYKFFLSL